MTETKPLDIKFQQRFSRNVLSNVIYFLLSFIIGIALVPYFLDTLGEAAYGLIPLATSITSYVTLFIDAVNGAISRYLTIDLQKGDRAKSQQTFNTAIFGSLAILMIIVPISMVIAGLAPILFDTGDASAGDVIWLFALVFGSVLIRAWSSNFMVTLFAHNRLDLRNRINNVNLLIQVVVVIALFTLIGPSLPFVGLSYLIASIVALVLSMALSKKVCPYLTLSVKAFSISRVREIIGIAAWIVITRLGIVLRSHMALIIVNVMFGAVAGTEYSLTLTWMSLITSIVSLITTCFVPQMYAYRAADDKNGMIKFTKFTVKFVTLFTALLVGMVCIFASQLITIWVGEEYADLAMLMWIIVIPTIFVVQSSCCAPINASYLRVKWPAYSNIIAGCANILLALILPLCFGMGLYGVALATGLATMFLSMFFSPMYGAHILKIPLFTFVKPAVYGYTALIIFLLIGVIVTFFITINGILQTCIAGGILAIIYLCVIWYIVLNKKERYIILGLIPQSIIKIIPAWIKK